MWTLSLYIKTLCSRHHFELNLHFSYSNIQELFLENLFPLVFTVGVHVILLWSLSLKWHRVVIKKKQEICITVLCYGYYLIPFVLNCKNIKIVLQITILYLLFGNSKMVCHFRMISPVTMNTFYSIWTLSFRCLILFRGKFFITVLNVLGMYEDERHIFSFFLLIVMQLGVNKMWSF
jgi:hypothetical protein